MTRKVLLCTSNLKIRQNYTNHTKFGLKQKITSSLNLLNKILKKFSFFEFLILF
jgi:hypothetical protein